MAEFCLDCINKYILNNNEYLTEKDVVTDIDLCESCKELKPCVIRIKGDIIK